MTLTAITRRPALRSLAAALATVLALVTAGPISSTVTAAAAPAAGAAQPTATLDAGLLDAVAAGSTGVIVRTEDAARATAMAAVRAAGGVVTAELDLVDGFAATIDARALDALTAVTGVLEIALDGEVTLAQKTSSGGTLPAGDTTFVETIGADDLHAAGYDGAGVGIAIIDTGVTEVADLAGRVVGALDVSGDNDDTDHFGHGTFIAGIAAGDGTLSGGQHAGVAPAANVIPVKIAGRNGATDVSHVLAAMQYVVSFKDVYGIRVLNLSLGTDSTQPQALSPLNYAVERAWDAGIVVVVSGGNHGAEGAGRIPKPADDPLVITVGATDFNGTTNRNNDTVADYSSRGPSIADGFDKPDIVAPGSHLIGPIAPGSWLDTDMTDAHVDASYAQGSGTSFAAGVVSGAAALLLDAHPGWTPDQVKEALLTTTAPGPVGDRNVDGFGAIDVAAAVSAAPAPGSQGLVVRSTGLGSIQADRGSVKVVVSTSGLWSTLAYLLGQIVNLTGEITAQLDSFDPTAYTTADWTNSGWYNSGWYNSGWYNSGWYNSGWYNSGWYNSGWYNSGWYNSGWY